MNTYIAQIMIGSKTILRFGFFLCGLFLLAQQEANATHIVGGHLTYRCLGNNQYEIRLSLRRDCQLGAPDAPFDDPASIGFFDATTLQPLAFVGFGGELLMPFNADDTLNQILISDCAVVGIPVCVHQTTYVDTIFLPQWDNGYIMAYQRCCRNGSVLNIMNPISTGMTIATALSGEAQNICKSSPQIGTYPPVYICVNKDIHYFPDATDVQGDSLAYEIAAPFSGGDLINNMPQPPPPPPYAEVNWRPPYSLANVMGGIPLQINPVTGEVTGTPNTIGQFVITIVIKAYRNGIELTRTRVDFQYNVRDCHDVPVAEFTAPELDCNDLSVTFTNQSVFSDQQLWIFDYGNPGSDISFELNPTYTYPADGFYQVALITNDSGLICFDTTVHTIGVFSSVLSADFDFDVASCTDEVVLNISDSSSAPLYPIAEWNWLLTYGGNVLASTDTNPTFTLDVDEPTSVLVVLIVTDINGCTATTTESFQVQEFDIQFNPDADSICSGDIVNLLIGGNCDLTYTWEPPNGLDLTDPCNPIAFPGISVDYYVTVTDGLCEIIDSTHVGVQQLPNLAFDYETDCRDLEAIFSNSSTNGNDFHWDFGDPNTTDDTSDLDSATYTYTNPGIYIVTLSSRDGCDVSITDTVTVNSLQDDLDPQTINCFENSIQLNPDFNLAYTYSWSPADSLDDPNSPNPNATVTDDTEFCVTITQASLEGCEITNCITVIIPDDFEINAGADLTSCNFEEIDLTALVTGNTNLEVVWTDTAGNTLGTGLILQVIPQTTSTYIVTATDTLGCSKADTVTINRPDPTFAVTVNNDTTYCNIQTITLFANSIPGITFEWFNANNDLIGTGDSVQVTPGVSSCFYVIGTDPLDCQESDSICLTPVFFNLDISGDQSQCLGDPATISVTDFNGQNLTYSWSPVESIISGLGTPTIVVDPSSTTTYTVVVTNVDLGCVETLSSTVTIWVFDPLVIIITATEDTIILTQSTQLTVNQDPTFGYEWSASPPEDVDNVYNPIVSPESNATYTVTVTDHNGCTGTATISIAVLNPPCDESDIFLPNAFTPNNDGYNDLLLVRSNFVTDLDFHIYNRWGQEVFSTSNPSTGWDGTFNGKLLEPDVFGYYFTATCPNGETYFEKGNITLLH